MAVKMLSFLGTGKYDECEYYLNDVKVWTNYIQTAIIQILHQKGQNIDEICILLTPEARSKNWEGEEKLQEKLLKLTKEIPFSIKEIDIRFADDVDAIWDMFATIVDEISEGDEIVFDVTHSFRYQPMLAMLAVHFLRVTKDVQVLGVYYGVYDPKSEVKKFPVIDLTSFTEMQDWITNVYSFTKTGRVDALSDWLMKKKKMISKQERQTTIDMKSVEKLSKSWKELIDVLQTNRVRDLTAAAELALQSIEEVKQHEVRPAFKPLTALLTTVQKSIQPMAADDEIISGFAAIEWCMEHDLIQQAYTVANELAITAFCKKNGIDLLDYKKREEYSKFFRAIVKANNEKKELNLSYYSHIPEAEKIYQHLSNFSELLTVCHLIGDKRNDINHAGLRKDYLSPKKLKDLFVAKYSTFKNEIIRYLNSEDFKA